MPHAMCPRDRSQASKDPRQIRRRSRAERMLPCPKAMSGILRRAAGFLTSTRSRTTLKIAQTFRADHDASCTVAGGCGKILREGYHRETGQERTMHFVISGTWGPTDPTRAMLPFIFAASAVQDGDTVTLMLFHDAVLMAVEGAGAKLVPQPIRGGRLPSERDPLGLPPLRGCSRPCNLHLDLAQGVSHLAIDRHHLDYGGAARCHLRLRRFRDEFTHAFGHRRSEQPHLNV